MSEDLSMKKNVINAEFLLKVMEDLSLKLSRADAKALEKALAEVVNFPKNSPSFATTASLLAKNIIGSRWECRVASRKAGTVSLLIKSGKLDALRDFALLQTPHPRVRALKERVITCGDFSSETASIRVLSTHDDGNHGFPFQVSFKEDLWGPKKAAGGEMISEMSFPETLFFAIESLCNLEKMADTLLPHVAEVIREEDERREARIRERETASAASAAPAAPQSPRPQPRQQAGPQTPRPQETPPPEPRTQTTAERLAEVIRAQREGRTV